MYLYSYFITYLIITFIVIFSNSAKSKFILILLLQSINILFLKYEDINDYQNYKLMFDNPTLAIDFGWNFLCDIIGSIFNNYNVPITLIIILNLILSSSLVFSINNNSLLQKSILLFLLIKWSVYEFVTLRFGLASLICLTSFVKNKPNFFSKYILFFIATSLHYSIFIFCMKYFWNNKWKLASIFFLLLITLPIVSKLDPRILHYLDVDELEFNYSVFFTLLFFISFFFLALYFENNKSAQRFGLLLIIFSIAIIFFQKFDTFNRVFFGLFILSAFNWSRFSESRITKNILSFCFLLFSQIVLLRYTFFANDLIKLIYK